MNNREETIKFYDAIAEKSFKEWFNNDALLPTLHDFIASLPNKPRVLDLGCGTGGESKRLISLGAKVIGIDLSEKSIRYAISNVPEGEFHVMDILSMTFPDSHFDGVMEAGVLFHFPEIEQISILKKIYSIMTKDGFFLSINPEGSFEGFEDFNIDGLTYKRYARKTFITEWIDTVGEIGFSIKKRLVFDIGTFKAILFTKA
jgi:SAM-dependent methyltransferase